MKNSNDDNSFVISVYHLNGFCTNSDGNIEDKKFPLPSYTITSNRKTGVNGGVIWIFEWTIVNKF